MLRHDIEAALAGWRAAERTLAELTPGTRAHADAELAVGDAKRGYSSVAAEGYDVIGQLSELATTTWTAEGSEGHFSGRTIARCDCSSAP